MTLGRENEDEPNGESDERFSHLSRWKIIRKGAVCFTMVRFSIIEIINEGIEREVCTHASPKIL